LSLVMDQLYAVRAMIKFAAMRTISRCASANNNSRGTPREIGQCFINFQAFENEVPRVIN
jgi:hypothetical protein